MHKDKYRHFAKGKHRCGRFFRLARIVLPVFLMFAMLSACMGHRHGHKHGHGDARYHDSDFGGRHSRFHEEPASSNVPNTPANVPSSAADAPSTPAQSASNATPQDALDDELLIVTEALERAVLDGHITQEQMAKVYFEEKERISDVKAGMDAAAQAGMDAAAQAATNSAAQAGTNPAAQAGTNSAAQAGGNRGSEAGRNSNAQAGQEEFRSESRRSHRHRRGGFSPIGFIIAGLFKLGLLFLLFSAMSRFFGFRPWRRPLGFRRWQEAYADAWGTPFKEETPVAPEDDEDDDIARELEREEQAQKAKARASQDDQPAKKEAASDSDGDGDEKKS